MDLPDWSLDSSTNRLSRSRETESCRIVFKNTKQILGGRVKAIVSGSAPLSDDTQEFLTNCLDCPIVQGYGLTETTAGATLQDKDDVVVGVAGPPLNGVYIRLVDWDEGEHLEVIFLDG